MIEYDANPTTCDQLVKDDAGKVTICDRPLPDTALVCPACVHRMRVTLRRCVELWPHVEAAVGRGLRLGNVAGTGTRTTGPAIFLGPRHPACDHESCDRIWKQDSRARNESPIPNEEPLLINADALEEHWAVVNTLTTWARLLSEVTGDPIYDPQPRRRPEAAIAAPLNAEARCEFSDLPTRPRLQCACGHPRRSHA